LFSDVLISDKMAGAIEETAKKFLADPNYQKVWKLIWLLIM